MKTGKGWLPILVPHALVGAEWYAGAIVSDRSDLTKAVIAPEGGISGASDEGEELRLLC